MDPLQQSTVLRAVIRSHVDKQADWISLSARPSAAQTLAYAIAGWPSRPDDAGPRPATGLPS
ncbi:hypothetical protein [Singulisphaera sp. PoT]|uniref:hypothetical protein n=1 Tax=Singulisphaera sp. PoT TaxID=3411797 RepID=UPI003BF4CD83